jgi:hypothetical protein
VVRVASTIIEPTDWYGGSCRSCLWLPYKHEIEFLHVAIRLAFVTLITALLMQFFTHTLWTCYQFCGTLVLIALCAFNTARNEFQWNEKFERKILKSKILEKPGAVYFNPESGSTSYSHINSSLRRIKAAKTLPFADLRIFDKLWYFSAVAQWGYDSF